MRVLLDTVTFIWCIGAPQRVSRKAIAAIESGGPVELSAVSVSEIAIKHSRGKLNFSKTNLLAGLDDLNARVLAYNGDHAYELFGLPHHHPDPFDRQIIAQALAEDVPVVTCDEQFRLYNGLTVIW